MVKQKGINLFYDSVENRQLCCNIRKVRPLEKILSTLDGWITGMNARAIMGTLIGVTLTASYLSGAVVNPIVGLLADQYGFDLPFRILAMIPLLSLPILKFIKEP